MDPERIAATTWLDEQIDAAQAMGVQLFADGPRLVVIGARSHEYCRNHVSSRKEPMVARLRERGMIYPPASEIPQP